MQGIKLLQHLKGWQIPGWSIEDLIAEAKTGVQTLHQSKVHHFFREGNMAANLMVTGSYAREYENLGSRLPTIFNRSDIVNKIQIMEVSLNFHINDMDSLA